MTLYDFLQIVSRGELVFVDTKRTFEEAEENCVSMGGHLVSIQNEGENIEIGNFIAQPFREGHRRYVRVLFGLWLETRVQSNPTIYIREQLFVFILLGNRFEHFPNMHRHVITDC